MDLTDIIEYFIQQIKNTHSSAHRTFIRIDHMLDHNTNLVEIMTSVFFLTIMKQN